MRIQISDTEQHSNTYEECHNVKEKAEEVFSRYGVVNGVGIMQYKDGFALAIRYETVPRRGPLPNEIDGVTVGEVLVIGTIHLL